MFIKQLSIFVENKFGRLEKIISDLGKNGINISALSMADTTDFGILRIIVNDPEKAREVLRESGVVAKCTEVLSFVIDDNSGGLANVLKILTDEKISIEYMYAFVGNVYGKAIMVVKVSDEERTEKIFAERGIEMLSPSDVYRI